MQGREQASGPPEPPEPPPAGQPTDFVPGRDYTEEDGLVVFTASFLLARGKCCRLGCLNCPYGRSNQRPDERADGASPPPTGA